MGSPSPPSPAGAPTPIDEVFGPGGHLARTVPGYSTRAAQVELSVAVDRTISTPGASLLAEAPTGCHVAGQGILLADGRVKNIEHIVVGDVLMGPDGGGRVVEQLARGEQETAWIVPVKGVAWRVNLDHVLTLQRTGIPDGKRRDCKAGQIVDVTVRKYLRWNRTQRHLHKLMRVGVGNFTAVRTPCRISPYHLGLLLGDGHFAASISICKVDLEIEEAAHELANSFGLRVRTEREATVATHFIVGDRFGGRTANPLIAALNALGLKGARAGDKFVPHCYKVASREQRLQLIAGLIDTDGSSTCGGFDYASKSETLANDLAFLARSVGLAAYVKPKVSKWQGGEGTYFRVSISGDCQMIPCRLPRKKITGRAQIKSVLRTGFSVMRTGVIERYYGFSLSGDGRYLLDDFTVTHNTGKSIAYLVPAIHHAVTQGRRAVVVTANIALQEQLVTKDLPALKAALPWQFSFALVKGIGNYLCRRNYEKNLLDHGLEDPADLRQWRAIVEWAKDTDLGDVSELEFEPAPRVRLRMTTSSEDCVGRKCPKHDQCGAMRARATWLGADVLVTNYHLFFADLALRISSGGTIGILPAHDVVVADEGHNAADIAREFFGFKATLGGVRWATRLLAPRGKNTLVVDRELQERVLAEAEVFFTRLAQHAASDDYRVRLRRPGEVDSTALRALLEEAGTKLRDAAETLPMPQDQAEEVVRAAYRCSSLAGNLKRSDELHGAENWVYFIDALATPPGLSAKPVDVSPMLREHLFGGAKSVVVTSATLAAGGSFDYVACQLGAEKAEELVVGTPFDWAANALLVLPPIPAPVGDTKAAYVEAAKEATVDAVRAAGGRALVLCTSRVMLKELSEALRAASLPWEVMVQGEEPRTRLLRRFREDVSSVLVGTDSFWEGVDVPGEALSLVIIDKIPFDSPDDPVTDSISTRHRDWFQRWMIPRAIIALRQGVGRLLRTATDRGVVEILDRRLIDKGYGQQFIRSLPPMRMTRDRTEVGRFLE